MDYIRNGFHEAIAIRTNSIIPFIKIRERNNLPKIWFVKTINTKS